MTDILIIEDDFEIASALRDWLASEGYSCHIVSHGRHALDYLERQQVRLICLDLMMPVMDGREFLHRYEQTAHSAPVIVITAVPDPKVQSSKVRLVLQKPVDLDRLEVAIERALATGRRRVG